MTAEHLASAKAFMQRMQDMISIQTGFKAIAPHISLNMAKPWKNAVADIFERKTPRGNFGLDQGKPYADESWINKMSTRPEYPELHWPPIASLSEQIVDEMAEFRAEETEWNEETAKVTIEIAELMAAQNELTRKQMVANIAGEKFNKRVLVWTLVAAGATLVATIISIVVTRL